MNKSSGAFALRPPVHQSFATGLGFDYKDWKKESFVEYREKGASGNPRMPL